MNISVACPKCQARLKLNKLPTEAKTIKCPRCQHPFTLSPSGKSSPPGGRQTFFTRFGLALGIAAVILLICFGTGLIFWLNHSAPMETKIAEKQPPVKRPEPQQEKQEKKIPVETIVEKKEIEKKELVPPPNDTEQKRKEFTRLMIQAGRDREAKRFEAAITSYEEALKIFPGDEVATQSLGDCKTALAALNQTKQADEKLKEELALFLKQGQESLDKGQYAAAAAFFNLALQKVPGDSTATKGLAAAQEALAKNQDEQKKQAEFDRFISAGRSALKAGRFADAIREFAAAQNVLPNNPLAVSLQKQAEQELAFQDGKEKQKRDIASLLDQGAAALRNKKYDDAENAYRQALKLIPNDPQALQGLMDTQRLAQLARNEYLDLMNRGNQAMRDQRFQDAVNVFNEAVRLFPSDDAASRGLRDAQQALERVNIYDQAMKRATAAMTLKRYNDAVLAYNDALRAVPNDPVALQGLQDAQRGLQDENKSKKDFDAKLKQATLALQQQKYDQAGQLLNDCIKLFPNHPQIQIIQRQARYADAMAKGQAALVSKNKNEAIRQFQLALTEIPGDFAAQNGLLRAKTLPK